MKQKILISMAILIMAAFQGKILAQPWMTTGNGIGATDFLGTTNGFPLNFKTANTQRMHINENLLFTTAYLANLATYPTWLSANYPAYGIMGFAGAPNGFVGINTTTPRTRLQI